MLGCEIPPMAETCKVKGKLHVVAEILGYKCHPNQFSVNCVPSLSG